MNSSILAGVARRPCGVNLSFKISKLAVYRNIVPQGLVVTHEHVIGVSSAPIRRRDRQEQARTGAESHRELTQPLFTRHKGWLGTDGSRRPHTGVRVLDHLTTTVACSSVRS